MTTEHHSAQRWPRTPVFFGDSVTDADRQRPDLSPFGEGYVRILADTLSNGPESPDVVNLGVSGNRVRDLRARWGEVQSARPDLLTILIGINDVWRHFDSDDYTTTDSFREDFRFIMDGAVELNTRVLLMEPFLLPVRPDQHEWLPELREKIAVVNQLAALYGAHVVHLHELLNAAATNGLTLTDLAPDGVHPSVLGHGLIAEAWLSEVSAMLTTD